ncbi:hypothetical protein F6P71_11490 [Streptococcus suis]|nr:hypothetical protein DP111_00980 [Streptococcus suis]MBO8112018.1 hypothetical protein [Streptococcus suis]MBS8080550.1 hypothetical protein [Streptococcus suis]MBS8090964.1 hypothetical protein [Streptococcus suis]
MYVIRFAFITAMYEETSFPYFPLQIISSLFEFALPYSSTARSSLSSTKSKLKDFSMLLSIVSYLEVFFK